MHINEIYEENDDNDTTESKVFKTIDILGEPVKNFEVLKNELIPVDENHYVIKKILETGGGMPLHDGCTVSIAFSGYWENELQPFDVMSLNNPMVSTNFDHPLRLLVLLLLTVFVIFFLTFYTLNMRMSLQPI